MKKFTLFLAGLVVLGSISLGTASIVKANEGNGGDNNVRVNASANVKVQAGMNPEMQIGVNGKVLVRGAKITAISGNIVSAQLVWGSYVTNWTVDASNANLVRHFGGKSALSEMAVGNIVSFSGSLDTTAASATVKADTIKDWSIDKMDAPHFDTLQGNLKVIGGTTAPTSLTVTVKDADYTVNVAANTAILNNHWGAIGLGNLSVNDNVRFYGSIDGNVSNATVIRDVSK